MSFSRAIQAIKHHQSQEIPTQGIPKLIHQIYAAPGDIPPDLQNNINSIKKTNPDWEHRLYDKNDIEKLILDIFGSAVLATWKRIDPAYGAARADLFRYLCLYHFGGVYLDIKSNISKPLNTLIRPDDSYLLAQWDHSEGSPHIGWGLHKELKHIPGGEYIQWFIACSPGHPFIKEVLLQVLSRINRYNPIFDKTGQPGVLRLTGPIAYSKAIQSVRDRYPHRHLIARKSLGFVYSIYDKTEQTYQHRNLFGKHYSQLPHPIVHVTPWRQFLFQTYCRYRKKPFK
ncbi:glycosyltransferase family 32 protein [Chromobacterium piscinae]|uniref:glycosyltransferase family 32 protein n=1 Tax=Chromobacterium piscinae TaxID=686831 RepID=UPI00320A20AA